MSGRSSATSGAVPSSTAEVHVPCFLPFVSELSDIELTAPVIRPSSRGAAEGQR